MAKGKGFGGFPGMGGGGNMNQLLAQAQKMQKDMEKAQEEVATLTADATAGGGAVKAVVNGSHEVVSLSIDPGVVDPEDVEMLQDLVVAAINEAMRKIEEISAERMSRVTGGMGMPHF
ncbi:MAG: YbaB/EbfC family nucleoid-associated protein [Clostridiaceae bacterium]|jgi:DNA-binding YbaB/EbfC family protein|nr:YbaB/EbfC family nucleoid-associated protein [Clostridiaceae bacterium]